MMIHTLLDACEIILKEQGEPQTCSWLASQSLEMKLWRASEADVRDALNKDIKKYGEFSRFMQTGDGTFALGAWT